MRVFLAALFACVAAVTCAFGQTAIRPDQIAPGTPDITWGLVGNQYQIGSIVPWRSNSTATPPAITSTDLAKIIELTFNGAITQALPATTGAFGDGAGFTIQTGPGTLTLTAPSGTINGITGTTGIKVGAWQSVALASRGGNWYATYSLPQPSTQTGANVLADNMTWVAGGGGPAGPTPCTESNNFIARATGMNTSHQNAFHVLICGLVTDGVFATIDVIYVFATDTQAHANLNIKGATSTYTVTTVGSPTFTPDTGYTNTVDDEVPNYLETGFNPSTAGGLFAQNSATMAFYNLLDSTSGKTLIGAYDGTYIVSVLPHYTDGKAYSQMNGGASDLTSGTVTNALGLTVGTTLSNTMSVYRNTALVNSAAFTPTGRPNLTFWIMKRHDGTSTAMPSTLPVVAWGSAWSLTLVTAFYNRVVTYLDTIHGSH